MDQLRALEIETQEAVTLWPAAEVRSPLILASPHAGRDYGPEFLAASRLDGLQLRKTEDAFVDLLFQDAPECGVPLLCANFPRAWVDVNRDQWELDPSMFVGRMPAEVTMGGARVAAGLGAIPRVAARGAPIYQRKLLWAEGLERLELGWRPYHRALALLIEQTRERFGYCVLIDCHSMPSMNAAAEQGGLPVDFVLGDAFGTSCRPDLVAWCETEWQALGYQVRRNAPYAGGFVTRHYGKPAQGVHVMQLEMARRLYMEEATVEPHQGFAKLRAECAGFVESLVRFLSPEE